MRLGWLLVGAVLGVMAGRNADAMSAPVAAAVGLVWVVTAGFGIWAAWRDRRGAVATAVAVANAHATAQLNAVLEQHAAALAVAHGGSVNVYSVQPGQAGTVEREPDASEARPVAPTDRPDPLSGVVVPGIGWAQPIEDQAVRHVR